MKDADAADEKIDKSKAPLPDERKRGDDFRIKQLDIGTVENAIFREKWWQIW